LYPVRVKTYDSFEAVNYDKWDICEAARILGDKEGISVFEFVKDSLIRRFGTDWYERLEIAAKKFKNSKSSE
jgi:Protein of unknown function (DUF3109)